MGKGYVRNVLLFETRREVGKDGERETETVVERRRLRQRRRRRL